MTQLDKRPLPIGASGMVNDPEQLREQLVAASNERDLLRRELETLKSEQRELSAQVAAAEQEHGDLLKRFVAICRLHESPDRHAALAGLQEIIVNIVGSESFAIFEIDGAGRMLVPTAVMGVNPAPIPLAGADVVSRVATAGERYIAAPCYDASGLPTEPELAACIPLKFGDQVVGAIAIYRLLLHKHALEATDAEVLDLLTAHAAGALVTAELRAARNGPRPSLA
jgi:hypothetical protein